MSKKKLKKKFNFEFEDYQIDANLMICTPLRLNQQIDSDSRVSILNQEDVKFLWSSLASQGNASYNRMQCYNRTKNILNSPSLIKYVIFIDRDIIWNYPKALNEMIEKLENSESNVAFSYCSFKYVGDINFSFYAGDYSLSRLLYRGNYISTMSIMKISAFDQIGGFDIKLKRFQDWDLWIRFGLAGYIGKPVKPNVYFFDAVTELNNSISGKSTTKNDLEFLEKHKKEFLKE